jgi:hypothetical protein
MGYTMPNTSEGWTVLIAALTLLALGMGLLIIYSMKAQKASRLPQVNIDPKY